MSFMHDRRTGFVLHIRNSNETPTEHPTLEHAVKHASFIGAQERKTNNVGMTIHRPDGHTESHSVEPMNETQVKAHKEAIKMGDYRPGKPVR